MFSVAFHAILRAENTKKEIMLSLDTHAIVEDFIAAGMAKKQAEVLVSNIRVIIKGEIDSIEKDRQELVTKNDLKAEAALLKNEFKSEMALLKNEFKADMVELRSEFKADMAELKTELKTEIAELRVTMKLIVGILLATFLAVFIPLLKNII